MTISLVNEPHVQPKAPYLADYSAVPNERIHPEEGMVLTPQLWKTAHDYHDEMIRSKLLYTLGQGIISGLNVRPYQPNDANKFWIEPGIAIDSAGRLISLVESYNAEIRVPVSGQTFVWLTYAESEPIVKDVELNHWCQQVFIEGQHIIQVADLPPKATSIELARIQREPTKDGLAPIIRKAKDFWNPAANEIDLRHRQMAMPSTPFIFSEDKLGNKRTQRNAKMQVKVFGDATMEALTLRGAHMLAASINAKHGTRVIVELSDFDHPKTPPYARPPKQENNDAPQKASIDERPKLRSIQDILFYIGVHRPLEADEISRYKALIGPYLGAGGMLLIESGVESGVDDPDIDGSIQALLKELDIELTMPEESSELLTQPNVFTGLPRGYFGQASWALNQMQVGRPRKERERYEYDIAVVYSKLQYAPVWAGQVCPGTEHSPDVGKATREEIRAAHELGEDLLHYAMQRSVPL